MNKDFIIEDGVLRKYVGISKDIVIPKNVQTISGYAFCACSNLTKVIIPDSVTIIGEWAFCNCTSLISVTIGNSVTRISRGAFENCFNLTEVTIGRSVISIGHSAFSECRSLTNITIPGNVTSIVDYAFDSCLNLQSVTVPDSVTYIGMGAFDSCTDLKSLKHNYKAFKLDENGNLYAKQNNMQYKLGRTERFNDEIKICNRGFHYCTNIFDIFNYYYGKYGKDFVICICDVNEDSVQAHEKDSKCCTDVLTPIRVLTRQEVIDLMNGKDRGI